MFYVGVLRHLLRTQVQRISSYLIIVINNNNDNVCVCVCVTQMTSQRYFARLFSFVGFVSVLMTMFYVTMSTVGPLSHHSRVTNNSFLWSALDNLSSSVFVPQPNSAVNYTQLLIRGPPGVAVEIRPRCSGIVNNDNSDRNICRSLLTLNISSNIRPNWTVITPLQYTKRTENCDCFRSDFGYYMSPEDITDDERQFPIAFSLLTYENVEQTERLLRLIYRPHNVYCIHVDAKSAAEVHRALKAIAGCFDNVFVATPPVSIEWGKVSIIHAEILCMRQLLDIHKRWKYFINLVGRDFPLRTNYELVKILQAYNGANDVEATRDSER